MCVASSPICAFSAGSELEEAREEMDRLMGLDLAAATEAVQAESEISTPRDSQPPRSAMTRMAAAVRESKIQMSRTHVPGLSVKDSR
jgi:hypothetical protein